MFILLYYLAVTTGNRSRYCAYDMLNTFSLQQLKSESISIATVFFFYAFSPFNRYKKINSFDIRNKLNQQPVYNLQPQFSVFCMYVFAD